MISNACVVNRLLGERVTIDLAEVRARQRVEEDDLTRVFVGLQPRLGEGLHAQPARLDEA